MNPLTPENNIYCQHRFTCAANQCDVRYRASLSRPPCHMPGEAYAARWHERDWDELDRITWNDMFSLRESWLYALYLLVIAVFMFFAFLIASVII
ncbi:MAG TPA: hypothetical protein HA257_09995 [Candidatus Methanoperedenaceae archaeon]|nr:hypothetical protein [Candidatus Methanoperedenaceae archaeon]